jgi:predicted transcriptional regulator
MGQSDARDWILDFVRELRLDTGHVLPVRPFGHKVMGLNPVLKENVFSELDRLAEEGIFDKREDDYFLTEQGRTLLYMEDADSSREWIISFAKKSRLDTGHSLPARPFALQVNKLNPVFKEAVYTELDSLAAEGFFDNREGDYFLTEQGRTFLYK